MLSGLLSGARRRPAASPCEYGAIRIRRGIGVVPEAHRRVAGAYYFDRS